ncbi:MAG: hypothetical protein NT002_04635 [candidate division Zixibacteria bacterium]|nr:hypothetical protein [candidate division Zixibacteria bacterium]
MPKKILLAEKSDAIRAIAESLLHQNGYDVISASSTEKAKELIITSQPNMLIVGADLKDPADKYLYDSIEENPATSSIPLLLIADPEGRSLPYPDEVILTRPFDPREFIEKVRLFVGGGIEKPAVEQITTADPFAMGTVDDEFLDAALGIDNIDVESSEVVDKKWVTGKIKMPTPSEKGNGFAIHHPEFDETAGKSDSQKVESLMIREEGSSTSPPETEASKLSASSKIEIASDQYGLIEPDKIHEMESKHSPHDYNWFIKEMQKEAAGLQLPSDTGSLHLSVNHEFIEPINPPAPAKALSETPGNAPETPEIIAGGVDEFIAEFKKEMEKIDSTSESAPLQAAVSAETPTPAKKSHSESMAAADDDELRHFSNYMVELLAEKLAKQIIDKINAEEIYRMVKDELATMLADKK